MNQGNVATKRCRLIALALFAGGHCVERVGFGMSGTGSRKLKFRRVENFGGSSTT